MAMFWVVLVLTALAIGLLKLGALSVWVTVFKAGFMIAAAVICFLVAAMLWRRVAAGLQRYSRGRRDRGAFARKLTESGPGP